VAESKINPDLYGEYCVLRDEGPVIPGLTEALVPQGMAYWAEEDLMIISNYMNDDSAGTLSFINMGNGLFEKIIYLFNSDGTPHLGHLGGLALSRDFLWLASGPGVYNISLEALKTEGREDRILLPQLIETETKGSFATYYDNILWVGEFTRENGSYPVPPSHHFTARGDKSHRGWVGGYRLNTDSDMINRENIISGKIVPDLILSIPDEIQGIVFTDDKIYLSASFGRRNDSRLLIFNNPLKDTSHLKQDIFPDRDIPFWFLDDMNKTGEIPMPPMSEALVNYKDTIAVLFESASSKYRSTSRFPQDRIQFLPIGIP